MKYLITCLIVAALAGCDKASDTTGKPDADVAIAPATEQAEAPSGAAPETVREPRGWIKEYGIYLALRKGRIRDDISANTGKIVTLPVLELVKQTDRIPLVKDTYFAYRFSISYLPKEVVAKPFAELRKVLIHPEMTLPDGSKTTGAEQVYRERPSAGQVLGFDGYTFSEDYELVEGDWTFQIWYEDKLLVEQKFTTYWPEEGAGTDAGADAGADQPAAEPAVEGSI